MNKIRVLFLIFSLAFAWILTALFKMQVLDYSMYLEKSERNRIRPTVLEAPRGVIRDRTGRELVSNRLAFDCYAIPYKSGEETALRRLAPILKLSESKLLERYASRKRGALTPILLSNDVSPETAIRIEESAWDLPNVYIETRPIREYRLGEAAAHITGYIGAIGDEEYDHRRGFGFRFTDWLGRSGLERVYDGYLRGEHGVEQFEADSRGRLLRVLDVRERVQGRSLDLTIDQDLQRFTYELMKETPGAVVVMELEKGGILALVSSPSYDPNIFVRSRLEAQRIRQTLKDPLKPLLNRALIGEYPPGSTFKIISALAALQANAISGSTRFFCPGSFYLGGFRFGCWKKEGHGSQDLLEAIEHSCNVFFFNTGMKTGPDAIARMSRSFGLGELARLDLGMEGKGLVPDPKWKEKTFKEKWYAGETANFAIGQGHLLTTPLQMVRAAAVIATGGRVLHPYIVSRVEGVDISPSQVRKVRLDSADLALVRRGMERVVASDAGTGQKARSEDFAIAGKTGTAQAPNGEDHAWFIGYAPAGEPRVAIVVFAERGGMGGMVSAPIAGKIFGFMRELGYF